MRSGRLAKPQSQRKASRFFFVVNMVLEFGNWRLSSLLRSGTLEGSRSGDWRVLCHGWREDPGLGGEGWYLGVGPHVRGGFSSEALGW